MAVTHHVHDRGLAIEVIAFLDRAGMIAPHLPGRQRREFRRSAGALPQNDQFLVIPEITDKGKANLTSSPCSRAVSSRLSNASRMASTSASYPALLPSVKLTASGPLDKFCGMVGLP